MLGEGYGSTIVSCGRVEHFPYRIGVGSFQSLGRDCHATVERHDNTIPRDKKVSIAEWGFLDPLLTAPLTCD